MSEARGWGGLLVIALACRSAQALCPPLPSSHPVIPSSVFVNLLSTSKPKPLNPPPRYVEPLAGVSGGIAQAFFVCPTQKLKVVAVADPVMGTMGFTNAVKRVVATQGVGSLYDGIAAMCFRRGMDWCIRFTVSSQIKEVFVARRMERGEDDKLSLPELMGCGMIGGAFSAITHPVDCVITNAQKPEVAEKGLKRDPISVARR